MILGEIDTAAVSRALSHLAGGGEDWADAFFESLDIQELSSSRFSQWREDGLAVRLVRARRSWLASRDKQTGESFVDALRQASRTVPRAPIPNPGIQPGPPAPTLDLSLLQSFQESLREELAQLEVAASPRLSIRRILREVQVVGQRFFHPPEVEEFYSLVLDLPWGRMGKLTLALDGPCANGLAEQTAAAETGLEAVPPESGSYAVVLGPAAAAVFLHEAVAHALEVDTLALTGNPEGSVGFSLGSPVLNLLDDPANAPQPVARNSDDEGLATMRRWLLREGRVEQPLADLMWSRESDILEPGAGRRANRHQPPGPRSSFLELLPGGGTQDDLMAEVRHGLYLPWASRGHLDARSGRFLLCFSSGRRIRDGQLGEAIGACRLEASLSSVLNKVVQVGADGEDAGAGWCAKGGQKLPVWARTPSLLLDEVQLDPGA